MTKTINNILSPFLRADSDINLNPINGLTNNLDQSIENTIAFYRLNGDQESNDLFKKRLLKAKASCVIVCGVKKDEHGKVLYVNPEEFENLQISLCDYFYPRKNINLVGVTGTNGKTSTVQFLAEILNSTNHLTATLGTLGLCFKGKCLYDFKMTMPGYIEIRQAIARLPKEIKTLAIEVSSHGLNQNRLGDLTLKSAGWTNFTQDHLDYHTTMKEYFSSKAKIQKYLESEILIPNNKEIEKILKENNVNYLAVTAFDKLNLINIGPYFSINYHKENFELAYSLAKTIVNDIDVLDMSKVKYPEGRFEMINLNDRMFIVDYAHTPDALEKLLIEIRRNFPKRKLSLVFGCGGDRDTDKRSIMGKIASDNADVIYITDDNPRFENPLVITNMISESVSKEHLIINDRKEAISKAYYDSEEGDIIVIAGKGHEKYQDIEGLQTHFSDQEIIRSLK